MMLAELVRQTGVPSDCGVGGKAEGALAMMHAMQSMYGGTAMDPFIGQCPAAASSAVVEAHARQNSTDSGLGTLLRSTAQFDVVSLMY